MPTTPTAPTRRASTDDRIRHQILDELRHHMPRLGVRVIRDIYEHARWSPEGGGNYKASYEQLAKAHRCSRRTVMRYVRYAVAVGCLEVRTDMERLPDGRVAQYPNVFSPRLNGPREIRMTYADFLRRREPIDYGGRPMRERQDEARWRRDRGPEKSVTPLMCHPGHRSDTRVVTLSPKDSTYGFAENRRERKSSMSISVRPVGASGTGAGPKGRHSDRAPAPAPAHENVHVLMTRDVAEAFDEACRQFRIPGLLGLAVQRAMERHGAPRYWRGAAARMRLYEEHLTDPAARQLARRNADDADRRARDAEHESEVVRVA